MHDFLKQDPKKVSLNQWDWLVMNPLITGCQTMKRFGGGYNRACHVQDGQKYVCMDNFPSDDNDVNQKKITCSRTSLDDLS